MKEENPFLEQSQALKDRIDHLTQPSAGERAMAYNFPHGGGFGHGSRRAREKRLDSTINRAGKDLHEIKRLSGELARVELLAEKFERGDVDRHGNRTQQAHQKAQAVQAVKENWKEFRSRKIRETLKPGDMVDIGGNSPIQVMKVNRVSITTSQGVIWKFGEIFFPPETTKQWLKDFKSPPPLFKSR